MSYNNTVVISPPEQDARVQHDEPMAANQLMANMSSSADGTKLIADTTTLQNTPSDVLTNGVVAHPAAVDVMPTSNMIGLSHQQEYNPALYTPPASQQQPTSPFVSYQKAMINHSKMGNGSPVSHPTPIAPSMSCINDTASTVIPPVFRSKIKSQAQSPMVATSTPMKMGISRRSSVVSSSGTTDGFLDPRCGSKSPLLPVSSAGKYDAVDRKSARLLYVWLGASTLVLQTTIFITIEDINKHYFSDLHYAFYCHNIFAFTFFIATATFAIVPSRILFSLPLLKALNVFGIAFATLFPIAVIGFRDEPLRLVAFIATLCLVGIITFMSAFLIPVVFSTASAIPGDCSMYAAFGQAFGVVGTAVIAVIMGLFLSPRKFILAACSLPLLMHGTSLLCISRLESWPWATRRLQLTSDRNRKSKNPEITSTVSKAANVSKRPSFTTGARVIDTNRTQKETHWFSRLFNRWSFCLAVFRRSWLQLLCALLATTVSFTLFPTFGIKLGHGISRSFGIAMVAIFQSTDQIGRHLPEVGLPLPPLALSLTVLVRFGFIPLYILIATTTNAVLGSVYIIGALQALLGLTYGWSIASAFLYIPTGSSKYEIERLHFSLSLINAFGIPCGAMLMTGLTLGGYVPSL